MGGVDDTWRIDVELLLDGPEAENAAKYWACTAGARGQIVWKHKASELFGTVTPSEAASRAAEFVTATYVAPACAGCGQVPEGVVVTSRGAASAKRSGRVSAFCTACKEAKAGAARDHSDRVQDWMATFGGSLPAELECLSDILLLDMLTQSDPFKDRRLRGSLLYRAAFSVNDIGRLFELGIIIPTAVSQPANVVFTEDSASYRPFEMDWHPAGEGTLDDRFEAIEQLAAEELHGALARFSGELESLARDLIVQEAERYLTLQLSDRGIDDPTEAQLVRFRESIVGAWTDFSLGQFYYAIWPACAKAADNKARNTRMGRDAVTGSAVNAIVQNLDDFRSGQRAAKTFNQLHNLPLSSKTVSVFRVVLDLDPMMALSTDVAAVLGIQPRPSAAAEEILEGVRLVHSACLESMPEEHAFTAAMASLNLLVKYYDLETINAARAAFAGERMASRFVIPGSD
ncbi:UNVERIFIED_ORG: hypothetical protein ABIB52_000731 [Arthrobacter sp. UYCu721]